MHGAVDVMRRYWYYLPATRLPHRPTSCSGSFNFKQSANCMTPTFALHSIASFSCNWPFVKNHTPSAPPCLPPPPTKTHARPTPSSSHGPRHHLPHPRGNNAPLPRHHGSRFVIASPVVPQTRDAIQLAVRLYRAAALGAPAQQGGMSRAVAPSAAPGGALAGRLQAIEQLAKVRLCVVNRRLPMCCMYICARVRVCYAARPLPLPPPHPAAAPPIPAPVPRTVQRGVLSPDEASRVRVPLLTAERDATVRLSEAADLMDQGLISRAEMGQIKSAIIAQILSD